MKATYFDGRRSRAGEISVTDRPTPRIGFEKGPQLMEIIDAWGQHPTLRHSQDPMFHSIWRWTGVPVRTEQMSLSETLEAMDAGGVGRMMASAWYAPRNVMISNDEVAGFVEGASGQLVGVGSVDISRPMEAVREVRRCIGELGFRAIRILPWLWEVPPTDRRFYPVYAALCDAGVPFCTQIGHTGPLMSSEVGRPIYLDRVALDFPELVIVAGHIGWPWTEEAIALATKHENVYIDTSAYTVRRYPAELVKYMRGHGSTKVLFGTNWPMISHQHALSGLTELGMGAAAAEAILGGNARRVFGLS
ncbi:amidohydrolase family protein [Sphingomonas sp. UYP23]